MYDTTINVSVNTCVDRIVSGSEYDINSFVLPVPGRHLDLNDIVISASAILLNPLEAFLVAAWVHSLVIYSSILCQCLCPCRPRFAGNTDLPDCTQRR